MTREPDSKPFDDAFENERVALGTGGDFDKSMTALREMAIIQLLYGQVSNAERFMKIALWVRPKDGLSLRVMAHVKAREGRALDAAKLLLAASETSRSTVQLRDWKEVGLALLKAKQHKLGARCLKKSKAPAPM